MVTLNKTYTLKLQHLIDSGENDSYDGAQVEHADDGSHNEFTNGLLITGHAALSSDAGPQSCDGQSQRQDQNGQDVGENSDDGRVEVKCELFWVLGIGDEHNPKGIRAGVG